MEELPVQEGMPDPFITADGTRITSTDAWPTQRVYLKAMLGYFLYGAMPPQPKHVEVERIWGNPVLEAKAVHERYAITLRRHQKSATFHVELIRPAGKQRVPAIIKNDHSFFEAEGKWPSCGWSFGLCASSGRLTTPSRGSLGVQAE